MSNLTTRNEQVFVAHDLVLRPSCTNVGTWLASWGEGYERETLELSAEVAEVLATLPTSVRIGHLTETFGSLMPTEDAHTLVKYLASNGMLCPEQTDVPPAEQRLLAMNWTDALVFHRATRGTLWRHEYPEHAEIMTWTNHDQPVLATEPRPKVSYDDLPDSVALSEPGVERLNIEIASVLSKRRTKRNFYGTTVPDWALSTLLHIAFRPIIQGANRSYFTTLSSADGYRERAELHPITTYALFSRTGVIGGQTDSVYRYNPETHALQTVRPGSLPGYFRFSELLWGQDFADDAAVALVLSVNWPQFMWKYRSSHAYRFAHYDLGAFMQTALLAAAALGMGAFITPALDDLRMSRLLGSTESLSAPTYFLALGMGADQDDDPGVPYM